MLCMPGTIPHISIVVPVYNEEDTISDCLDAIFRQTVAADEVIVVDNNSTDGTATLLDGYRERIVLLHEPRQGTCYARNTGLDAAKGELICRIDADTQLPERWVENVLGVFADDTVHAVTGPAWYYDIRLPRLVARLDLMLRSAWAKVTAQRLDWVYGANMAIRSSAWHAVRGAVCEDRTIHEDVDLGIHLFHAGYRVIFAPWLVAGTSGRRIRSSLHDFHGYLRMTERTYASHREIAGARAITRARLTNSLLLLCYFPLRFLHGGLRPGKAPARKNPMSEG
jgi:glycosyltransferase involved in cell wall biosynthesis